MRKKEQFKKGSQELSKQGSLLKAPSNSPRLGEKKVAAEFQTRHQPNEMPRKIKEKHPAEKVQHN